MNEVNEASPAQAQPSDLERLVMRPTCGMCKSIGARTWGLPENERSCLMLAARQADFDAKVIGKFDALDRVRFRPTQGVLPYSETGGCKYYEQRDA